MKKFVRRPSPAMIVALLALIVAASGTAVAASKLKSGDKLIKKHSLSGNRLRNHTVTSNQIKLSSLSFAGKAKWAIVQSNGTIAAQSGGISVSAHSVGSGSYYLSFGEGLVGKPVLATINYGNFAGGTPHDGLISAAPCGSTSTSDLVQTNCVVAGTNDANHLFVKTESAAAAGADRSFYVAVVR